MVSATKARIRKAQYAPTDSELDYKRVLRGRESLASTRILSGTIAVAKDSRPPCMTNVHALVSQGDWRSWSREENFVPLRLWTSRVRLFPPAFDMRNCYMLRLDR